MAVEKQASKRPSTLNAENERLRAKVDELQSELDRRDRLRKSATGVLRFSARLAVGPRLESSFREWLQGVRRAIDSQRIDEHILDLTVDLLAAILRRRMLVGVVVAVLAVIPAGMLLWQNWLIREQNAKIQAQLDQQVADTLIVRRTQLLATIYDEDCRDTGAPEGKTCLPVANPRIRAEAVRAFSEIERGRGVRPNLRGVNLGATDLRNADLSRADLNYADLSQADLSGASLNAADLRHADLAGVAADLTDLHGATLAGANLSAANLRLAENLTWHQLARTRGDMETLLPYLVGDTTDWARPRPFPWTYRPRHRPDSWILHSSGVEGWNLWRREHPRIIPDLRYAFLRLMDLAGANLSRVVLLNADLNGANLTRADLSGALLTRADFAGADLSGANLADGGLTYSEQINLLLGLEPYNEADLNSVKTAPNLSQEQIERARGDIETQLPEGLERPEHWRESATLPE